MAPINWMAITTWMHAGSVAGLVVLFAASRPRWPRLYAAAIWPGTFAHEFAHFLAGFLCLARPVAMSLWPRRMPDGGWRYGYVAFANLRWWNKIPIGIAPLVLFPIAGLLVGRAFAQPFFSGGLALKLIAVQLCFSAWPSRQDFKHAASGAASIACLVLAAYGLYFAVKYFH